MELFRIIFGGALIAFGRRLYWFFVAGFGFLIGLRLAGGILQDSPQWLILVLALAAGLAGALIAVTMQRFGIALAGFLAGAYISYSLLESAQFDVSGWSWVVYLVGGIAGAILLTVIFEWALILLSTIGGSVIAVQALELPGPWNIILFFSLFLLGLVLQGAIFKRRSTFSIS
jgi:hypothetical protein